ncbi:MAG: hypothetical protein HY553_03825 [Elusimicrobia bacterium]|nr:hypothetical protein [Elusimicrobiota bacterium]
MSMIKKAVWLAAMALVVSAGASWAGIEKEVANSGPQNWADLLKGNISFKQFLKREAKRAPAAKCPEGYQEETRGDEGPACWAKPGHGAWVRCEIKSWRTVTDEGGTYQVPDQIGKCESSWGGTGGFAGNGPSTPDTQSP